MFIDYHSVHWLRLENIFTEKGTNEKDNLKNYIQILYSEYFLQFNHR